MVKKISVSNGYEVWKTIKKVVFDFAIYGVPQLANWLIATNPTFSNMTVAGLVSIGVKFVVDYFKHRRV